MLLYRDIMIGLGVSFSICLENHKDCFGEFVLSEMTTLEYWTLKSLRSYRKKRKILFRKTNILACENTEKDSMIPYRKKRTFDMMFYLWGDFYGLRTEKTFAHIQKSWNVKSFVWNWRRTGPVGSSVNVWKWRVVCRLHNGAKSSNGESFKDQRSVES